MDKEQIKKAIDNPSTLIVYQERWKYPSTGDNQKTCPMLNFMFQAEQRAGTLIFIPDSQKPRTVAAITKEDVYGKQK